jgi:hypothetical protein
MRVCDLILGPPFGRARLADRLEEVTGWLGVEQDAQQEADAELEALWSSATRVQDCARKVRRDVFLGGSGVLGGEAARGPYYHRDH